MIGNSNDIARNYLDSLLIEIIKPYDYLMRSRDQLAKVMAYTGCRDLAHIDPSIVHETR